MERTIIINQVLILFIIMIIGFAARKMEILDGKVNRKLSKVLLYITNPFMIIVAFQFDFSAEILGNAAKVFICAFIIHAFSVFLAGFAFYKYDSGKKTVLKFITVFSNCGFMGLPVLNSLYGKTGVLYGSVVISVFQLFLWTYGIVLFNRNGDKHGYLKIIVNPGTISVLTGLALFAFSVRLPAPIFKAFDMVGSMTTPLSMMVIGALITEIKLKSSFADFSIYYGCFIRLLLIPCIFIAVLRLTGLKGLPFEIGIITAAMPAAANTAIFAEMFEGDAVYSSKIIGISTALSILTIPLIVILITL